MTRCCATNLGIFGGGVGVGSLLSGRRYFKDLLEATDLLGAKDLLGAFRWDATFGGLLLLLGIFVQVIYI